MDYIIGTYEDVHLGIILYLTRHGKDTLVEMRDKELGTVLTKIFEDSEEAKKLFVTLTEMTLKGSYSKEQLTCYMASDFEPDEKYQTIYGSNELKVLLCKAYEDLDRFINMTGLEYVMGEESNDYQTGYIMSNVETIDCDDEMLASISEAHADIRYFMNMPQTKDRSR